MKLCKIVTILFIISNTSQGNTWNGFKGCGLYKVKGGAEIIDYLPVLVIHKGTMSEITLFLPPENLKLMIPYTDSSVEATVEILEAMDNSIGKGKVKDAKPRIENFLDPQDTGIDLIAKMKCLK
jgi:hypothetical protein